METVIMATSISIFNVFTTDKTVTFLVLSSHYINFGKLALYYFNLVQMPIIPRGSSSMKFDFLRALKALKAQKYIEIFE